MSSRIVAMLLRFVGSSKRAAAALDKWRWTARSTVFAAFFAGAAFYLALHGKLTAEFVAMAGTLHVGVTVRAIAADRKRGNDDPSN